MYYEDELYHHGIKGMKWGVRRFRKKDDGLTPAGKKRYSDRQITDDMNKTFDKTYKELHRKYMKTNPATASDRAYTQAKKINTKHLIDTYGKERMDKYFEDQHKRSIRDGKIFVGTVATLSVATLILKGVDKIYDMKKS